jgi:mono/diheme cytochrome c family protein
MRVSLLTLAMLLLAAAVATSPLRAAETKAPAEGAGTLKNMEVAQAAAKAGEGAEQAALKGKQLFANTCGFCHAEGGRKASKGPKLAGSARTDEFLIDRIKNGKQGRMPAFGSAFSDEEIEAMVAYIRSLEP